MTKWALCLVVLVGGCKSAGDWGPAVAEAAIGIIGAVADAAAEESARKEAEAKAERAPRPPKMRSYVAHEFDCGNDRSYVLRCEENRRGEICFFETPSGHREDCVDPFCQDRTPMDGYCLGLAN